MQIKPSPALSGIVKHFLILESDQGATMRIFSDGNTGLAFNYGGPLFKQLPNGSAWYALPESFLYGQLGAYQNVASTDAIRLLIVVLHPYGPSFLLKIPAFELKNQIISLDTFWGTDAKTLPDQLDATPFIAARIGIIEKWLLEKIRDTTHQNSLTTSAIRLIHSTNGLLTVTELAGALHVHERQMQRAFDNEIGISPKRYSSITRIQSFLKLLRSRPADASLAGLACDSGFYDQPHLVRELKKISGLTPTQYLLPRQILAANLVRL